MMFRNDTFDGLWLEDRSNSDVYMDDSIYKGVGDVTSRQPPPMQTPKPKRGRVFVLGDSQTGGMRGPIRNYYKSLGYPSKDIVIVPRPYARYFQIESRLDDLDKLYGIKPGDQILIASVGGPESRSNRRAKHQERVAGLVKKLEWHKSRGVNVTIFGNPRGNRKKDDQGNDLFAARKAIDDLQRESFKNLNYNSIFDLTAGPDPKLPGRDNDVHYPNYQKYFDTAVKPGLSGSAPKTPNIKPATPPKVASASASTVKPAQPAPAQTAGTRNPTPAQTTPAQTAPAPTAAKGAGNIPARLLRYKKDVEAASVEFDVPVPLIYAIMQTESGGNPFAGKEKHERNKKRGKPNNQGLGLMQVIRSTFKGTTARMRRERIPNVPVDTEEAQYNPTNSIRVGTFLLASNIKKAKERYEAARKDPQVAEYIASMYYYKGPGMGTVKKPGGERYVRNQLKKHGGFDVIGTWDPDPTNKKTGKVSGSPASYVALTYKYRNQYAGVKSTAPKTTTTAPKASEPAQSAPKPAPKASEPAQSAPKPAPKAKSKISQPKVGPGERLVYPRRTSTDHPTKYSGMQRVQKVSEQGPLMIRKITTPERYKRQHEEYMQSLPKLKTPKKPEKKPRVKVPAGKTILTPGGGDGGLYIPGDMQTPQESRVVKPKPSNMMASARPETTPASRAMASVKRQPPTSPSVQPKNVASAGQRAMEQISSVKQQPTKRPSRFKSESFTPTRTV